MGVEIRERLGRVLVNVGVLALVIIAFDLFIPGALAIIFLIPEQGLSITASFILLSIIVTAFFALRVLLDLIRLLDLTTDYLIRHIPGFKSEKRISLKKALKELIIVLVLILSTPLITSAVVVMPQVGSWLTLTISSIFVVISVILIYDAGKTLYAVFQSGIQILIENISKK